ncbi:hypothetical protein D3C72_2067280 [compost metagenome]
MLRRFVACSADAGSAITRIAPGCVGMIWLTTATFCPGTSTPRPCSCRPAKACGLVYSFIRCRSQYNSTLSSSILATVWESTSFWYRVRGVMAKALVMLGNGVTVIPR